MTTDNLSCVPKVRFPGFDEQWRAVRLGDVAELVTEKVGAGKCIPMSVSSGKGLIPQTVKFGRVVAGGQLKNYTVIHKYDFAYNKSATSLYPEGYIAMLEDYESGAVPNSIFTCFRIKAGISPFYLNHLFSSNYHGKWLGKFIEVGARAHGSLSINDDCLLNLPLHLPSLDEQQKIASCLSSVDEVIKETEQKIESLKEHNKGLRRRVLHENVNSVDYVFSDKGQYKRLDECAVLVKENLNVDSLDSDVKYISTENMISDFGGISEFQSKPLSGSYCVFRVGDILLSNIRPYLKKIWLATNSGICSADIIVIRPSLILSEYLAVVIKSDSFVSNVMKYAQGVKMPRGDKEEIMKYSFYCPHSFSEQQKIASCLSSIDDVITSYKEKLRLLQLHKKGLMQQLFPPMNINL